MLIPVFFKKEKKVKPGDLTISKAQTMRDWVSMIRDKKMKNYKLQFRTRGVRPWLDWPNRDEEPEWNWKRIEYRMVPDETLEA